MTEEESDQYLNKIPQHFDRISLTQQRTNRNKTKSQNLKQMLKVKISKKSSSDGQIGSSEQQEDGVTTCSVLDLRGSSCRDNAVSI